MRNIALSLAALLLLPLPGLAQTPAAEEPIFGEVIDVRVINVEVVVTDRDGKRVTDLRPTDFQLKVDGKEVPIGFFTEVREGVSAAPSPAGGQAASTIDPGSAVGTSYLVFIDDFFSTDVRRNEVLQSLKLESSRLSPQDRMALVAWNGGRLALLSNWSNSPDQIGRAIDSAMRRPARGLDRYTELRTFRHDKEFSTQILGDGRVLDLAVTDPGLDQQEMAYGDTLSRQIGSAVSAAVGTLRAFSAPPGRKVFLLLSGGWPFSVQSYVRASGDLAPSRRLREGEELLRPLTDTANLLGYTVYPVDVPGHQSTDPEFSAVSSGNASLREQEVEGTLEFLAQQTGGKPIRNGNRTQVLSEAGADTRSYYWLGFTPTWKRNDKSHKVKVEVSRPGLKVRARTGFLDLSRKAEVSMKVESALLFGSLPGSVPMPLKVGTPRKGKKRGTTEVPITLGLPVDVLTIVPVDGKFAAQAELRLIASGQDGNNSEIPVIPLNLKSDKAPKAGGFVRFDTEVLLRGKASRLVVALYDPIGDKIATAEADIPVF